MGKGFDGVGIRETRAPGWQPIETAPKNWLRTNGRFLVGCWHQPIDEDGNPDGEGDWAWVQCVGLAPSGWHVNTGGFKGINGHASFLVSDNATHWMPLPPPPQNDLPELADANQKESITP